jgi:hypothetical protein
MGSHIFMCMTHIYFLSKNDIPFYIGKTKNVTRRKHHHYNTYGTDIKLEIIDICTDDKKIWKFWETYWIQQFKAWEFKLLNKNTGGGGPTIYTEESKKKMRKPRKEGTGEKISKTLRANNHSQYYTKEIRQHLSNKLKGKPKPFTEEHIKNISKANLESKGKTVECYDLNNIFIKEFPCLREAKLWLLKTNSKISTNVDKQIKDCCLGRQKTCHKFKWNYK